MEKTIEVINQIKSTLRDFEEVDESKTLFFIEIEQAIGKPLPEEIKSFFANGSMNFSKAATAIFMGYEPIELESIAKMYRDPKDRSSCYFLGALAELSAGLVLNEGEGFEIVQDLEGEVEGESEIIDMKTIVPVMSGSGYYMVLLYKPDGQTEIAIATEDYCISSIAPSLNEYLDNLEVGVRKGVFAANYDEEVDELEIEAPEVWRERLEAIASK